MRGSPRQNADTDEWSGCAIIVANLDIGLAPAQASPGPQQNPLKV